jgi:hypothetical protein
MSHPLWPPLLVYKAQTSTATPFPRGRSPCRRRRNSSAASSSPRPEGTSHSVSCFSSYSELLLQSCRCHDSNSSTPVSVFTPTVKPSACVELAYLIMYMLTSMYAELELYSTAGMNHM